MKRLISLLFLSLSAFIAVQATVFAADDGGIVPDNNSGRWAFLVGFVLPLVIATVNRHTWSTQMKGACTLVVSAIAALGTSYFAGEFVGKDIVSCFLIVAVSAVSTHTWLWKPSGIANSIEARTG